MPVWGPTVSLFKFLKNVINTLYFTCHPDDYINLSIPFDMQINTHRVPTMFQALF